MIHFRRTVKIALFLLLAGVGCGGSHSNSREKEDANLDYSCASELNQGDSEPAVPTGSPAGGSEMTKTFFNKEYSPTPFKAIASASAAATIKYLQDNMGVAFYRADTKSTGKCLFYSSLSPAPESLQQRWKKVNITEDGLILSGLYVKGDNPSILVRPDSNRWTILHEMSHHLFEIRRKEQNKDQNLTASFETKMNMILALDKNGIQSQKDEDDYIYLSSDLLNLAESYISQTSLEEMTVESKMQDMFNSNQIRYIPNKITSSKRYVKENADAALAYYEKYEKRFEEAKDKVKALGYGSAVSKAWNWTESIAYRRLEIQKLIEKYSSTPVSTPSASTSVGIVITPNSTLKDACHLGDEKMDRLLDDYFRKDAVARTQNWG